MDFIYLFNQVNYDYLFILFIHFINFFCRTHGIVAWIGLSREGNDDAYADLNRRRSSWMWEDESTYNDKDEWYTCPSLDDCSEPGPGEYCAAIVAGKWHGFICEEPHHCVCKYYKSTTIQMPTREFYSLILSDA